MSDWRFIDPAVIYAAQGKMLAQHGGSRGIRDAGALISALDRPRNLAAYGDPDLSDLAASYAFGVAKAHAFVDGNKRAAWVAMRLFIRDNGRDLSHTRKEAVEIMVELASDRIGEVDLASWIRSRIV